MKLLIDENCENLFQHRYRVRRGLGGNSVLQKLEVRKANEGYSDHRYVRWVDVPFNEAPRALKSEISE